MVVVEASVIAANVVGARVSDIVGVCVIDVVGTRVGECAGLDVGVVGEAVWVLLGLDDGCTHRQDGRTMCTDVCIDYV